MSLGQSDCEQQHGLFPACPMSGESLMSFNPSRSTKRRVLASRGSSDPAGVEGPFRPYNHENLDPTPGTRLGPFEIVAALGAGGMGEVDHGGTRLDRDVSTMEILRGEDLC